MAGLLGSLFTDVRIKAAASLTCQLYIRSPLWCQLYIRSPLCRGRGWLYCEVEEKDAVSMNGSECKPAVALLVLDWSVLFCDPEAVARSSTCLVFGIGRDSVADEARVRKAASCPGYSLRAVPSKRNRAASQPPLLPRKMTPFSMKHCSVLAVVRVRSRADFLERYDPNVATIPRLTIQELSEVLNLMVSDWARKKMHSCSMRASFTPLSLGMAKALYIRSTCWVSVV